MHMRSMRLAQWFAAGSMLWAGACARGDGFRNPPETAAALGKAGKCVVWVDDASAVFYNPANLVELTTRQVQLSAVLGYSSCEFHGSLGAAETYEPWSILPAFALAWPLGHEDLSVGLGVHVPYGRKTRWEEESVFRYGAPVLSEMSVVDITPALAWRALDCLAVGAGLDLYYGEMGFRQYLPWPAVLGGGEGLADADLNGWALGAHAGVTWELTPRQRLSLTYRTPFDLDYEGDLDVQGAPLALLGSGLVAAQSDLSTTFSFPAIVVLGYGFQVSETVRLEADIEWLEFSRYESLDLDANENNYLLEQSGLDSLAQNWDDTWTAGLSVEWRCAEHWTLRAGYVYLDTPTVDSTFSPALLDQSQSVVSLGLGFETGRHRIDVAYAFSFFNTRDVRDNQTALYDGDYDLDGHLAALTYTISF